MLYFDIQRTLAKAAARFGDSNADPQSRRRRTDRGRSRMPEPLLRFLNEKLSGIDRPRFVDIETAVAQFCEKLSVSCPSRVTLYHYMAIAPLPTHDFGELPGPVQRALYNLDKNSKVPAHQVVFAAFNYGDLWAISFAAGLPWLALYQADRVRGWRPKSHALLRAVMKGRGL